MYNCFKNSPGKLNDLELGLLLKLMETTALSVRSHRVILYFQSASTSCGNGVACFQYIWRRIGILSVL